MVPILTIQERCTSQKLTQIMNKGRAWGEIAMRLWMPGAHRIPVHGTINIYFWLWTFIFSFEISPAMKFIYLNVLFIRIIMFLFGGDTGHLFFYYIPQWIIFHGKTYLFGTSFWFNRKMVHAIAMQNTHFSPCADFWHINARSFCSLSLSRKTCPRLISSSSLPFKVAVFQCHLKTELW